MANTSQIRQLQTPDHNIDIYPLTLEDAVFDGNGTQLTSKLNTINSSILAIGGRIDDTQSDIAPVEDGSTSTRPYTVGKYLIHNDIFYKVIQEIAIDDTLTVGTNIQETKVVDEMDGLAERLVSLRIAEYDSTDESLTFRADSAEYDVTDESILINI